jgi:hypothetical protein
MSERIRRETQRLVRQLHAPRPTLGPESAYEALLDQRLQTLAAQLEELKGRVNGLIFLVVGTVVTEVVLRLVLAGR